jgi:hypothetical protein
MNIQLVDSLIQVIESLTPEECLLFQEKLSARAIQSTPGVCGGYARIRNTRIPVWTLVSLHQQGPMRLSYFVIIRVCRIAI